jgi:hypothetical protein
MPLYEKTPKPALGLMATRRVASLCSPQRGSYTKPTLKVSYEQSKSIVIFKLTLELDIARAVFSRDAKKNYVYRGLIEHDRGQGNGFHKC